MPKITVVENPKRRTRRRMTAKQRKYFGPRRRSRRRRNPVLASLGNPRRRRYRRRTQYVRGYRRRRNPRMNFLPVSLMDLAGLTAGAIGSKIVPGMVRTAVPQLPTGPFVDYGIKVASGWLMAQVAGMVAGSKVKTNVFTGALVAIAVDWWNEYGATMTGLGDYYDGYLSENEMLMIGDGSQMGEYLRVQPGSSYATAAVGEYIPRQASPMTDFAY